jgi:hypothetical protein
LASSAQQAAIASIQRRQYGHSPADEGGSVAEAFEGGFAWRDAAAPGDEPPMPPLYPFDTGSS